MSLLDFFKKKQRRKKLESSPEEVPEKDKTDMASKKDAPEKAPEVSLGESKSAPIVLIEPKITEKSSVLSEKGAYVFQVDKGASKQEIRRAVQDLYGVEVERVNAITVPPRSRRVGRTIGRKPGYRKAIVKLKEGQKIEYI